MEIKFDDLTDQQCADIIAHFIKRKNVNEIIIHTKEDDIVIQKTPKVANYFDVMSPIVILQCTNEKGFVVVS